MNSRDPSSIVFGISNRLNKDGIDIIKTANKIALFFEKLNFLKILKKIKINKNLNTNSKNIKENIPKIL